jgi:hypothetical protein
MKQCVFYTLNEEIREVYSHGFVKYYSTGKVQELPIRGNDPFPQFTIAVNTVPVSYVRKVTPRGTKEAWVAMHPDVREVLESVVIDELNLKLKDLKVSLEISEANEEFYKEAYKNIRDLTERFVKLPWYCRVWRALNGSLA